MKRCILATVLLAVTPGVISFVQRPMAFAPRVPDLGISSPRNPSKRRSMRCQPLRSLPNDLPSNIVSTASADIMSMSDDVYGPVFAGGIALMFAGILSAFVVGNLIPDDAWEYFANEGENSLFSEIEAETAARKAAELTEIKEKGEFDDY